MQYFMTAKNTFLHFGYEEAKLRKAVTEPNMEYDFDLDEETPKNKQPRRLSICSVCTASTDGDMTISPGTWSQVSSMNESLEESVDMENPTTLMIRNIPCKYLQSKLVEEVAEVCSNFDFVYLPPARTAKVEKNLGYAFINFKTCEDAAWFEQAFQSYQFKLFPNSTKRAQVTAAEIQGKQANLDYYYRSKIAKTQFAPFVQE